jgi:hypothetical protein
MVEEVNSSFDISGTGPAQFSPPKIYAQSRDADLTTSKTSQAVVWGHLVILLLLLLRDHKASNEGYWQHSG